MNKNKLLEKIKQDVKDVEEAQDDVDMCNKWNNYEDMGFSQYQLSQARDELMKDLKEYLKELEGENND